MIKFMFFITFITGSLLSAREMNPVNPDFNHSICLTNRSVNPGAAQTRINKREALEALVKMNMFDIEHQSMFRDLHPAYQAYYKKLRSAVRSDGHELSSFELDRQLDLSGSCDGVDSVLLDIIKNLK